MIRITPRKVRFRPPHPATPPADTTEALRGSYKTPEPVNSTCRHNASLPRFPYAPGTRQQVVLLLSAPAQTRPKTASKTAIRPLLQPNIIPYSPGHRQRQKTPNSTPYGTRNHIQPSAQSRGEKQQPMSQLPTRPPAFSAIHPSISHLTPDPTARIFRSTTTKITPITPTPRRQIPGGLNHTCRDPAPAQRHHPAQSPGKIRPLSARTARRQPRTSLNIPGIPPRK